MIPISQHILTSRRNRPFLRRPDWYTIRKLKGIVIHWTANTGRGANAIRTRGYFNTTDRYASAHYIVDDHSIVQCIPDHEVAYHVGGRWYRPIGEEIREGDLTPNYFLIGIEMCVNSDGDWDKTYRHTVELTQHLLNKYNFTINELYRHYDITGKDCPKMMLDEKPWQDFKDAVNRGLDFSLENPIKKGIINTADLNVRTGNGVQFEVVDQLHQDDEVEIYELLGNWYRIGDDRWVHKHYVEITFSKKDGVVNVSGLNVRTGPSTRYKVVDTLRKKAKVEVFDTDGNWYNIGKKQWVYGTYVDIIEIKNGRVVWASFLNVRSGPGTNNNRVKQIARDTLVKVYEQEGNWYRIGDDEWVYSGFIEIIE